MIDGDRGNFVLSMGQVASNTETDIYAWALITNDQQPNGCITRLSRSQILA
jgi:hypothetical protein